MALFSNYQSLVLYYFAVASSMRAMNSVGKMFGVWDVITMAFTCVVVAVNLRLWSLDDVQHNYQMASHQCWWKHISMVHFRLHIFRCCLTVLPNAQENIYIVIYVLMRTFCFYLTFVLDPVATLYAKGFSGGSFHTITKSFRKSTSTILRIAGLDYSQ